MVVLFAIYGHVLISFAYFYFRCTIYVQMYGSQSGYPNIFQVFIEPSSHIHDRTGSLQEEVHALTCRSQKWAFILKVSRENAACEVVRARAWDTVHSTAVNHLPLLQHIEGAQA